MSLIRKSISIIERGNGEGARRIINIFKNTLIGEFKFQLPNNLEKR